MVQFRYPIFKFCNEYIASTKEWDLFLKDLFCLKCIPLQYQEVAKLQSQIFLIPILYSFIDGSVSDILLTLPKVWSKQPNIYKRCCPIHGDGESLLQTLYTITKIMPKIFAQLSSDVNSNLWPALLVFMTKHFFGF